MSVGPSALGTILLQRLDAVMGITMGANANLISGARPNAVAQPGAPARPGQSESATSGDRRSTIEPGAVGDKGQVALRDAKLNTGLLTASNEQVTSTDATASAPTTLGQTARTILALLAQYPDGAPNITGKAPLWQFPAAPAMPQSDAATVSNPPTSLPSTATAAKTELQVAASLLTANNSKLISAGAELQTVPRAAEPAPAMLAQALRHALQNSGLFYEAHLADLAFGRRTIAQLESEPQARLTPTSTPPNAAVRTNADITSTSVTPTNATAVTGIHPEANLLVRQQLDVLAHQALAWRGEAWPGAPMEWEIERQNRETADVADTVQSWATRLRLELPRLGMVEARLNLAGNQLVMQLTAPSAEPQISASSNTLRDRLLAAGLTLSHLSVSATAPQSTPSSAE